MLPQVYNEIKAYNMKTIKTSKHLTSNYLCSKPYLTIWCKRLLLMKGFEDHIIILVFFNRVLNTTIHVTMETKPCNKEQFATTYRR